MLHKWGERGRLREARGIRVGEECRVGLGGMGQGRGRGFQFFFCKGAPFAFSRVLALEPYTLYNPSSSA